MTHVKATAAMVNFDSCDFVWTGTDAASNVEINVERLQAHLIVCVYARDVQAIKAIFSAQHASRLIDSLIHSRHFPVHAAIMSDDRAVLRVLVEALPAAILNVQDERGRTALMCAAELGHADAIHILLAGNAAVDVTDASGYSALTWAALSGHAEAVKVLLGYEIYADSRANVSAGIDRQDNRGNTALMFAIRAGHYDVVEALVERTADVNIANSNGERALSIAVSLGVHRIVRLLCEHERLELNAVDIQGITAVMHAADYAAQSYDSSILSLLIKCSARTDLRDSEGCTVLLRAAKGCSDVAIEFLVLAGVGLNAVDPSGRGAVALAAKHNNLYALRYLLRQPHVEVDTVDDGGRTPLYHAIEGGYYDAAYELIKHGANINLWHAKSGTTLLSLAKRRGGQAIVNMLTMHHSTTNQITHGSNMVFAN